VVALGSRVRIIDGRVYVGEDLFPREVVPNAIVCGE
jgi:hypothetical protein